MEQKVSSNTYNYNIYNTCNIFVFIKYLNNIQSNPFKATYMSLAYCNAENISLYENYYL